MPYTVIRGRFRVIGYEPDGDSIRFEADNRNHWSAIGNVQWNTRNHVQLRFQAIDTPEIHAGGKHQPLDLARASRDRLFALLGITGVQFGNPNQPDRVTAAQDGTRGTLLAQGLANRRPISFVFTGTRFNTVNSGGTYQPSLAQIRTSVNYTLAEEGHTYPLFYTTLDAAIRTAFTNAVINAYNADRQLWPYDWSQQFRAANLGELEDLYLVFPKLFRRLVNHMRHGGSTSGFVQALRNGTAGENDRLELVTNPGVRVRMSDVLMQSGNSRTVRLLHYTDELVFV